MEVIHEATLAIVDEVGPAQARLAAIAQRAGISYGMLYQFFPSRDELLLSAVLAQLAKIEEKWRLTGEIADPLQRIIAIAIAPIDGVAEHARAKDILVELQGSQSISQAAAGAIRRGSELGLTLLGQALRDAQREGFFPDLNPDVVAVTLLGISEAYGSSLYAPISADWAEVKHQIPRLIRRLAGT